MRELKSTNILREFARIKDYFPNIRGNEDAMAVPFQCLEGQLAWFVKHELVHTDEEILQALAAAGLVAYDRALGHDPRSWDLLPEVVQKLALNLTMSFDPSANPDPELQKASRRAWVDSEAEAHHFRAWGSVIRRLVDSVTTRQKRDPRGYCRFVVPFMAQLKLDDRHEIQWVIMSKQAIDEE